MKKIKNIAKISLLIILFIIGGVLISNRTGITDKFSLLFYQDYNNGGVAGEYEVRIAGNESRLINFADHFLEVNGDKYMGWGWESGVLMYGMWRTYEATGDENYYNFVKKFYDAHIDNAGTIYNGFNLPSPTGLDLDPDNGVPGIALTYLYEKAVKDNNTTAANRYKIAIKNLANYLIDDIEYITFDYNGETFTCTKMTMNGSEGFFNDHLFMRSFFLLRADDILNTSKYTDYAVDDTLCRVRIVQDDSGLFPHYYDVENSTIAPIVWSRGVGWVVASFADVLSALPKTNSYYNEIKTSLNELLAALSVENSSRESSSNLWYTVMRADVGNSLYNDLSNVPDNYVETSAVALIDYGFKKASNNNLLTTNYDNLIKEIDESLNNNFISKDGYLENVSKGIAPRDNVYNYTSTIKITTSDYAYHGAGAYLLSLTENYSTSNAGAQSEELTYSGNPKLLITASEIEGIKQKIRNGEEPWSSQYNYVKSVADTLVSWYNSQPEEKCENSSFVSKIRCISSGGLRVEKGGSFINFTRPLSNDNNVIFHSGYNPRQALIYWDGEVPACSGGDKSDACQEVGYTGFYNTVNYSDFYPIVLALATTYGDSPSTYAKVLKDYMLAWTNMDWPEGHAYYNLVRPDALMINMMVAYDLSQESLNLSTSEKSQIDNWIKKVVGTQIYNYYKDRLYDVLQNVQSVNNATVNLYARLFNDTAKINETENYTKELINGVIHADGGVYDRSKTLSPYDDHNGLQLETISYVAITAKNNGGQDLFGYSNSGISLNTAYTFYAPVFEYLGAEPYSSSSEYNDLRSYEGLVEIGNKFLNNTASANVLNNSNFNRVALDGKRKSRFIRYPVLFWGEGASTIPNTNTTNTTLPDGYRYKYDFNYDDRVDILDFAKIVSCWNTNTNTETSCSIADTNSDSSVGLIDLINVLACWGGNADETCIELIYIDPDDNINDSTCEASYCDTDEQSCGMKGFTYIKDETYFLSEGNPRCCGDDSNEYTTTSKCDGATASLLCCSENNQKISADNICISSCPEPINEKDDNINEPLCAPLEDNCDNAANQDDCTYYGFHWVTSGYSTTAGNPSCCGDDSFEKYTTEKCVGATVSALCCPISGKIGPNNTCVRFCPTTIETPIEKL